MFETHHCVCGHEDEQHEQLRFRFQPCHVSWCKCKDYTYHETKEWVDA